MQRIIKEFLSESNKIESVYDEDSLQQAIYAWEYLIEQKELTVSTILKTHKILMLNQKLMPDQKGYFRKVQVWVGNREGLPNYQIRDAIEEWCKDVMTSIEIPGENGSNIKIDHVQYEKIHPFIDGNGRTGRLFMNWQRVKAGLPILVIHEDRKLEYYRWFK